MIAVLVTGAGGGVGQGIIKSLKMIEDLQIRLVGADVSPLAAGLYACDRAYLVAPCNSDDYMASLERVFRAEDISYYLPGTDLELEFCARNKTEIQQRYGVKVVVNPVSLVRIADNKADTARYLAENGFPHPATMTAEEALRCSSLVYPVILKPAVGFRSIGVMKIESPEELAAHTVRPDGLIVQELIGTADSEYTCTIVGHRGVYSPVLSLRRELRSGDTYRAVPERHAGIEDYVARVAHSLGVEGSCNFQLRLTHDQTPKIFEINARFSGTTPLCAQLGFNPVEYYLKKDIGREYEPDIAWTSRILRFWSEVVVPDEAIDQLETDGSVEPCLPTQLKLFDT